MSASAPFDPMPTAVGGPSSAAPSASVEALLVTVLVALVAPALRALYPILFEIGEDWSYPGVGGIGVLLYASPVLATAFVRVRARTAVWIGVGSCLAALAVVAARAPITAAAGAAGTALALVGLTIVTIRLASAGVQRGTLLAGLVLGLALDTTIRGVLRTWDIVWRHDLVTLGVGLALAAAAVVTAVLVTRRLGGQGRPQDRVRASAVVALGGLLALEFLFLQSPAFVGSQSGLEFWVSITVVLACDAAALVAIPAGPALAARGRAHVAAVAILASVMAAMLTVSSGWLTVALVAGSQVSALLLLSAALAGGRPAQAPATWQGPMAAAGAGVLMVLLVFLWQFYVIVTLPFPRWAIPVAAAAAVGYAALRADRPRAAVGRAAAPVELLFAGITGVVAVLSGVALALTVPNPAGAVPPGGPLTVMTYNIRSGVDTQGQMRPDVIAEVIRESGADVVVLQEVGRGWAVHGGIDTMAYLEQELGMQATFSPAADGQFGNAVLTSAPILAESVGRVPYVGGQERSYTRSEVQTEAGPWVVVGAHLENGDVRQTAALFDLVDEGVPAVIAGDMNVHPDWPNAANLAAFTDAVAATGDACRTTSAEPTSDCDRPDWILVSPGTEVGSLEIGTSAASDHLPMVASLVRAG